MWTLIFAFFIGWFVGTLIEYGFHWYMHYKHLKDHIDHHKDFFHLEPRLVIMMAHNIGESLKIAFWVFLGLIPFWFVFGWLPVVVFFAGIFWHDIIVYPFLHKLIHDDSSVPAFIRKNKAYNWWKNCHWAHHFHRPKKNYSVTFPVLDVVFGTYVRPRDSYPQMPHPKIRRKRGELVEDGSADSNNDS